MSTLDGFLRELVVANRILAHEQICDSLGHVSVRHPDRSDRFFLSSSRSPELVTLEDIMEYDLDCIPIDQRGRPMYYERPIHGAIYKRRPDVMAAIHNHATAVLPFTLTKAKLRACLHPACALGHGEVPIWDIRDKFGDTNMLVTNLAQGEDLAVCLGDRQVALMRGHGCVVVAPTLKEAVLTAIYTKVNASVQAEAMRLGEVIFLSEGEIAQASIILRGENAMNRMWDYYRRRAGMDGYTTSTA